ATQASYGFYESNGNVSDRDYNQAMLMMLTQMTEQVNVISSSWSLCENTATPSQTQAFAALAQQAAGQGITIFFAINDQGDACNGSVRLTDLTSYPTGAPYIIAVGGSILGVGANGQYGYETWWGSGDGGPQVCVNAFNNGTFNGGCGGFGHSE